MSRRSSTQPPSWKTYFLPVSTAWKVEPSRASVIVTSAVTGAGVAELAAAIAAGPRGRLIDREPYLFERWVADEHGQAGLRRLAARAASTAAYLGAHGGLDGAQLAFTAAEACRDRDPDPA